MTPNQKILKYKIEDVKDLILVDKKLDPQFVEKVQDFINYITDFYGKDGIYEDFFKPSLSKKEIRDAVAIVATKDTNFDSITRETVRDILLFKRGERTTELNVREQFPELNLYNEKSPRGDFIRKYNPDDSQEKTDILESIWSGNKTIYVDSQHMDWISSIPKEDCSIVETKQNELTSSHNKENMDNELELDGKKIALTIEEINDRHFGFGKDTSNNLWLCIDMETKECLTSHWKTKQQATERIVEEWDRLVIPFIRQEKISNINPADQISSITKEMDLAADKKSQSQNL